MSNFNPQNRNFALTGARIASLVPLLLVTIFVCVASAAPADLDATFGTGGKVLFPIVPNEDNAEGVAIQADGKIVVGGRAYTGSGYDFAAARFNPDGTPDTSFSLDGRVTNMIGSTRDEGRAVVSQPDGKVLVGGFFDGGPAETFGVIRYDAAGVPDTTFGGGDGIAYAWFGSTGCCNSQARGMALQSDGKILLVGRTEASGIEDFAILRLDPSGALDTSFDTDGRVTLAFGSSIDVAEGVVVQPDGKILVAGYTDGPGGTFDFAVARLNPDGSLDGSFDGDGLVLTDISGEDDQAESIALQPDGSVILAGSGETGGVDFIALTRYKSNGALDASFGVGGVVKTAAMSGEYKAKSVALQNNDKIVIAGTNYDGVYTSYLIGQYLSSGALDTSFDGDGLMSTTIGTAGDIAYGVAIQPDGKIIAAGSSSVGGYADTSLIRLTGEVMFMPSISPPSSTITSPRGRILSARKLRKLAGTAGPAGEVSKVEIALRRVDKRALKRKRCIWLRNRGARFIKTKAVRKRCSKRRFLLATGTEKWTFKLKRPLPKGSYELSVRVTLKNGASNDTFRAADGTFRAFRLK